MYDTTGASEIICLHSLSIITVCQYFINFRLIFNYKNKRTCCVFPVSVLTNEGVLCVFIYLKIIEMSVYEFHFKFTIFSIVFAHMETSPLPVKGCKF